ncbi:hypothetical protein FRB95_000210 [Tulasnella sp. JGI-2019a]|nr:hypothetical protein FRB95_000210 [Tulasnella sp. JGI-2019a]
MPPNYERGDTRKVVAYGRRARNFIRAKDLNLTISPPAKLATVPQNVADPPYSSLDKWLVPTPVERPRVSSLSKANKENAVAPPKLPTLRQVTLARKPIVASSPRRRPPSKPRNTLRQSVLPKVPAILITQTKSATARKPVSDDHETPSGIELDHVSTLISSDSSASDGEEMFRQEARRAKAALATRAGTRSNPMIVLSEDESSEEEVIIRSRSKRETAAGSSKLVITSCKARQQALLSSRQTRVKVFSHIEIPASGPSVERLSRGHAAQRLQGLPRGIAASSTDTVVTSEESAGPSLQTAKPSHGVDASTSLGRATQASPQKQNTTLSMLSEPQNVTAGGVTQSQLRQASRDDRMGRGPIDATGARTSGTFRGSTIEEVTEIVQQLSVQSDSRDADRQKTKASAKEPSRRLTATTKPPSPPQSNDTSSVASTVPKDLQRLLKSCEQPGVLDFDAFVSTYPFDDIHGANAGAIRFRKIGEATYSEVFAIGDVVLKVVPLLLGGQSSPSSQVELPCVSPSADVENEILVTKLVGNAHCGFIKLLNAYVVTGRYPSSLLELWDRYSNVKESENIRPHVLPASTHYAIIVLPNGGVDLEAYTFPLRNAWKSAVSILWQVVRALAVAEDKYRFEHRDLHWGQVLVKDEPKNVGGVTVKIIDFGLSRLEDDKGLTHHTAVDREIFDGTGDYQFDVYRLMKEHCGNEWETFRPLSNVMWLHYLSVKLLRFKGLRRPVAPKISSTRTKQTQTTAQREQEEERAWYDSLVEVECYLGKAVKSAGRRGGQRKPTGKQLPESAIDVMTWMRDRAED